MKIRMKKEYKYLVKNIGLLSLSSFATKLLTFFLVPLYTSILSTSEYGTYDLCNATIGVLLPILTVNIQESVLRFSLEKQLSKDSIVSIGTKYFIISNIFVALGLILNHFLEFSSIVSSYSLLFFLMFFVQALNGIITCYIRGIDRVADLSISSVISAIITILCNILFLLVFRLGLVGYFIANIVGPAIQSFYLIIRSKAWADIRFRKYSFEEKIMIAYSKPLIVNSIAWWVNNVSDRYIIVFFCGLSENGIYSVASKIPAILNIFQTIFNQAWTLSAVKEFDSEDKRGFFSNTYAAYNCLMTIGCGGIILFNKVLAHLLYAREFYVAWRYVPWLTIAVLFGALSGYLGGFFSAVKDSKIFAISTIMGAITNFVLNIVFTPIYGAMGAAVATTVCYIVVWIYRFKQSRKYIKLIVDIRRDCVTYGLIVVQALLIYINTWEIYIMEIVVFLIICAMYKKEIRQIFFKFLKR